MKVEFYSIEELTTEKVAFYSVLLGDNENKPTEYQEFASRMKIREANRFDFEELKSFMINKIGVDGAIDRHFKNQGQFAERIKQRTPDEFEAIRELPDPKDYGLRLYCLRLSVDVVVLFNGDRKTFSSPLKCPNCEYYFKQANKIANAIMDAKNVGEIFLTGFDIEYKRDNYFITI